MYLSLVISTFNTVGGKFEELATQSADTARSIQSGVSKSLGSAELDSAGSEVIEHFADLLNKLADAGGDMKERVDHTLDELLAVDEINAASLCDVTQHLTKENN